MRVIGRDKLEAFCDKHTDARRWIENWLADAELAAWNSPQQIKNRYPSAIFLAENRVIFNVKGNDYRLEVLIAYRTSVAIVEWIGTHARYDTRNKKR
jgi:mRNA interferase HigB